MKNKLLLLPLLLTTSCSVNTTTNNISNELNNNISYIFDNIRNINSEIISINAQLHYYYVDNTIKEYRVYDQYKIYTYDVFATTYDCYIIYLANLCYNTNIKELEFIDIYKVSNNYYY